MPSVPPNPDNPFDFSDAEIRQLPPGRLLSMEIEFSLKCNYRCPYCYAVTDNPHYTDELTEQEIRDAIDQAAALGARKIVILGGEPLLYPHLEEMILYIRARNMYAEVFTNGALLDAAKAEMLVRNDCRTVVKLNTFDPVVHDQLTGTTNSLPRALRALALLEEAGQKYGNRPQRRCAATVLTTQNLDMALEMWNDLRDREILPYFEMLTPQGRLLENRDLLPDPQAVRQLFEAAAAADAKRGIFWEPQPPLMGQKCFRHHYSCLVNHQGTVFPCVGLTAPIGSIRQQPLAKILSESAILSRLKNHQKYIKSPCHDCEKSENCYGCRGAAWQMTGDYLAADPTCWRNAGKQSQIHALPLDNLAPFVPHAPPMRISGTLLAVADQGGTLRTCIAPDHLFLNADGTLEAAALIEIAAQTIAAFDGFLRDGKNIPDGLLVEIREFSCAGEVKAGDELLVRFRTCDKLEPWHIVKFWIANAAEQQLAEGELKLCISSD